MKDLFGSLTSTSYSWFVHHVIRSRRMSYSDPSAKSCEMLKPPSLVLKDLNCALLITRVAMQICDGHNGQYGIWYIHFAAWEHHVKLRFASAEVGGVSQWRAVVSCTVWNLNDPILIVSEHRMFRWDVLVVAIAIIYESSIGTTPHPVTVTTMMTFHFKDRESQTKPSLVTGILGGG